MTALAWTLGPALIFFGLWLCAPGSVTFDQTAARLAFKSGAYLVLAGIALLLAQTLYALTGLLPWTAAALLFGAW